MANFPTYGKLLAAGYAEQRQPVVVRTDMEVGPPKQRRTASRALVQRSVTYLFTRAEYASFLTWFKDTISHGTDWFNWSDPRTGSTISARIVGGKLGEALPQSGMSYWRLTFSIESWE